MEKTGIYNACMGHTVGRYIVSSTEMSAPGVLATEVCIICKQAINKEPSGVGLPSRSGNSPTGIAIAASTRTPVVNTFNILQ